jgi:hypothetical protein
MVIQQLLAEAGSAGTGRELVSVDARGAEAPADRASLRSPENYTSYGRTQTSSPPVARCWAGVTPIRSRRRLRLNHWALSRDWTIENRPPR